ncbi:hypothetical protein L204_100510 [Cryptococcus depauperatus]|nr:hypothetical protein L204_01560 [Cryptococcus depauperatus CBS 7855]
MSILPKTCLPHLLPARQTILQIRTKTHRASPSSLWISRNHLKPQPTVPPPVIPTYPMKVILSDGSSFTAYTTAPTPSTKKLTRDVNNNPLWIPASEKKGLGGSDEGRVGKFKRKYEDLGGNAAGVNDNEEVAQADTFTLDDLDWMSESAEEEKISERQRNPVKAKGKGKKK